MDVVNFLLLLLLLLHTVVVLLVHMCIQYGGDIGRRKEGKGMRCRHHYVQWPMRADLSGLQ